MCIVRGALKLIYYEFKCQYYYDTNKLIYQILLFNCKSNSMLWCAETELSLNPWLIIIVSDLVHLLIPNIVASW